MHMAIHQAYDRHFLPPIHNTNSSRIKKNAEGSQNRSTQSSTQYRFNRPNMRNEHDSLLWMYPHQVFNGSRDTSMHRLQALTTWRSYRRIPFPGKQTFSILLTTCQHLSTTQALPTTKIALAQRIHNPHSQTMTNRNR